MRNEWLATRNHRLTASGVNHASGPDEIMGRITSSVGLISGIPIQSTVDQLIALQAKPRDLLKNLNDTLSQEQFAVTDLSARLISLRLSSQKLGLDSFFDQRKVDSSDPSALSAVSTGSPAIGSFEFTPLQTVQANQQLGSGLSSADTPLGGGSFSIRFGGFVDTNTELGFLNGGGGFERGQIRITDRSGASADIDLRFARTADDVLAAVNNTTGINVRLETSGDRFRLVDTSGGTGNLKVQELGATTAASLGLAGIDVAANSADGQDVVQLFDGLSLNRVNDGRGIRFDRFSNDLQISFRDNSGPLQIDFSRLAVLGTKARTTTNAANGVDAQIDFTAVQAGSQFEGVTVVFQDNAAITAGNETVVYDDTAKTLTFQIDAGATTANNIISALAADTTANQVFTAAPPTGGNGTGLIDVTDTAVTTGPPATAITPGTLDGNARVTFTAVTPGSAFDGIRFDFVNDDTVTQGNETVTLDLNSSTPKIIFNIDEGNTTANDIVAALNNDPAASAVFTANLDTGSDGTGIISTSDTTTSAGGAIVEPLAAKNELTLGEVLATLNEADPTRLQAAISADGKRIELTDLTTDAGGTFTVTELNGSRAAYDLGLTTAASGGVITGGRLLSGLNTTLLSSLNGGQGISGLGQIQLTDRAGASATIDLAGLETLDQVLAVINAAPVAITAQINNARNGIVLSDTSGSTSGNLVVANADSTGTADLLGVAVNAAVSSVDSGNLRRQTVSENTSLADLNGGAGVASGTLTITDTTGKSALLDLSPSEIKTVGDVLVEIGRLNLGINARINDAGDGIILIDTAGGATQLGVTEGDRTTARDLHLLGAATTVDLGNGPVQAIDGSTTLTVNLSATDTLNDLIDQLSGFDAGFSATTFNDGSSSNPIHLLLNSQNAGTAGALLVDASNVGFSVSETVAARDALLLFGSPDNANLGILASSNTNTFQNVIPDVLLTIGKSSSAPVTVSISSTNEKLLDEINSFVDNYNAVRTRLADLTRFNPETGDRGILVGDSAALRVDVDLLNLLSGGFSGAGSIRSLETIGISVKGDGTLEFDSTKLDQRFQDDPNSVRDFFTTEDVGFSDRFSTLIDQLAAGDNSLLLNRIDSLSSTIQTNSDRIDFLNKRLDSQREQLLNKFIQMEQAIAKSKNSLTALQGLVPLPPL